MTPTHSDLIWLSGICVVIFAALCVYQLVSLLVYRKLKDAGLSNNTDTRYLQAVSLARSKLFMDGTVAIVAVVAIVAAALRILL